MCGRYVFIYDEAHSLIRWIANPTPREIATYEAMGFDIEVHEQENPQGPFRWADSRAGKPGARYTFGSRYNVRPTDTMPIITWGEDGRRRLELARWGLVPSWWKESGPPKFSTINARAETLASSSMWRGPFKMSRCLVPASGFYEWPEKGKGKPPVFVYPRDHKMFAFAGVADTWSNPETGERVRSYSIVTVGPNSLMEPVHDRMPAILEDEAVSLWMDPLTKDPDVLARVLLPYPAELMTMHRVSAAVNSAKAGGPELIEPAGQPGLC